MVEIAKGLVVLGGCSAVLWIAGYWVYVRQRSEAVLMVAGFCQLITILSWVTAAGFAVLAWWL